MDNLTHSLTGLALSRAGLDRFCPRAAWLLILSANAPDSDIVAAPQGAFRYLEIHRGYSHSVLALPIMAALAVIVVAVVFRQKLPWFKAWMLCVAGVASHLLLDATNSYGVRLLLPFSSRWFHLDLNSLYDVWILAALVFAGIWPLFGWLIDREIGERRSPRGQGSAIFALTFFLLFDIARATLHARVTGQLEARLYEGAPPLVAAALPDAFNPIRWTGVVETQSSYATVRANALGQLDYGSFTKFYKPPETAVLRAARSVDPFQYFLYFARFPVWTEQPVPGEHSPGTRVDLTDLRFGTPGAGSFHCVGVIDPASKVIQKWFTYGSGADLGWGAEHEGNAPAR